MMVPVSYDRQYLEEAERIARQSPDPSTKCGAVFVRMGRTMPQVIVGGWNQIPQAMDHSAAVYDDRTQKYPRVIHAEMDAIIMCRRAQDLIGATLYVVPLLTCERCAAHLVHAGIKRVVTFHCHDKALLMRWEESHRLARQFFKEANVIVTEYDR